MTSSKYLILIHIMLMCGSVSAAVVIPGDLADQPTSFSFPIFPHAYDQKNQVLFLASQAAAGGVNQVKDFALSVLPVTGARCIPLTPETVMLNFNKDQANPLYDSGISLLGLVYGDPTKGQGHPVVVASDQPGSLYFYYDLNLTSLSILQYPFVGDATGMPTSGIVGMSTYAQSYVMLGVKPTGLGSVFGDAGSGISLFILGALTQGQGLNTQNWRGFFPLDAVDGSIILSGVGKAVPFDKTQSVLTIGSALTSLGSVIDIHYSEALNRFYIAVQLQTGAGGGKAIVMGYVRDQKLQLVSIAPDTAFDTARDQIVGTSDTNSEISIHKVRTMHTSTNLSYLITVGGDGDPDSTMQNVYALPLVSSASTASELGVLAKKDADPIVYSKSNVPYQVLSRALNVIATQPADTVRDTDSAALVGGAELEAGPIADICVRGDTVFVAVGTPANVNELPGIYYSQAIFDELGKIKDWTFWQRVAGSVSQAFGANFEQQVGNFVYLTGPTQDTINTVNRTQWGLGSSDLSAQLVSELGEVLQPANGGIEKLIDVQLPVPGLRDISLLMATGDSTIVLAQTGHIINNVLHPTAGALAWPRISFTDGTIGQTLPTGMDTPVIVSVTGGVLSDIQKLVAAEIVTNGAANSQGWLFVGGTHGVAVLSDAAGAGWDTATGLGPNFVGLQAGMAFKKFGSYKFVRKIIYDSDFLYILTDTQLDRIDVSQENPGLGIFTPVTVASSAELLAGVGSFSDCMISGPFALLGTTNGLLRVGNGADLRTAGSTAEVGWRLTPPVEGTQAVYQIVSITKTGHPSDATNPIFDGANVYVLNTYAGKERAQITRYAIKPVTSEIDDTTVHVIPDMYVKDIPSFLMNFGTLRTQFMTDGALFLSARDRIRADGPVVTVPVPFRQPQSGIAGKEIGIPQSQTSIPLDIGTYEHVSTMLRSFASGGWLISGDFGLRINE